VSAPDDIISSPRQRYAAAIDGSGGTSPAGMGDLSVSPRTLSAATARAAGATVSGGAGASVTCAAKGAVNSRSAMTAAQTPRSSPVRHRELTSACSAAHELHKGAHRNTGRPLGQCHKVVLGIRGARYVQVHPRIVCHELLEEQCGGNGTCCPASGVLHVGNIALDQLA